MLNRVLPALFLAASFGLFSPSAASQCQILHDTGCPGAAAPACHGTPAVGARFGITCPGCGHDALSLLALGACVHPIPLDPHLACGGAHCSLVFDPTAAVFLRGSVFETTIPHDRGLIGLSLCAQCVCVDRTHACLTLSAGLRVTITH